MNVLKVLDAVIDGECMDTDVLLMQARAAVAELMDSGRRVVSNNGKRTCCPREGHYYRVSRADFDALTAALARCKGESHA